jgi:MAF protein
MIEWILASNSPRRKELLALFGNSFTILPADINEARLPGEPSVDYVNRLACEKAKAVAALNDGLIIAADTIVADGEQLLGKPGDENEAREMLYQLRGRIHQVYTGIALIDTRNRKHHSDVCCTKVPMREYSNAEVEAYIETGDPMDKAGAYAIQHPEFHPVEALSGCYASVMGLHLCHLLMGLKKFGCRLPDNLPQRCQRSLEYHCPIFETILKAN